MMTEQFPIFLGRLSRRWQRLLSEQIEGLDITRSRWMTLLFLQQVGEGMTQREFADELANEQPTLVRMLDNLELSGLVERRLSEQDRRVHHLYLTPPGHELMHHINTQALALNDALFEGLSENDIARATQVIKRVMENVEKQRSSQPTTV